MQDASSPVLCISVDDTRMLKWYKLQCSDILFSRCCAVWDINSSVEEGRWCGEYLYYWLKCWSSHPFLLWQWKALGCILRDWRNPRWVFVMEQRNVSQSRCSLYIKIHQIWGLWNSTVCLHTSCLCKLWTEIRVTSRIQKESVV